MSFALVTGRAATGPLLQVERFVVVEQVVAMVQKQGGGGDGCGVMWQDISDLVLVWIARDRLTYYIHVIAPHNRWPVS